LSTLLIQSCTVKRTTSLNPQKQLAADTSILQLADPTIFLHNGVYYLYGTGGNVNNGFMVYTSPDLKHWKGPAGASAGYALVQGDSYGTKGFWAPQVFYYNNKFYMAYTANENIAIAQSASPLGPFKQQVLQTISGPGKQIDPYVFFDDNGKAYLYHVRLTNGNRLYVAELNESLTDIVSGTEKFCFAATDQAWENTENTNWPVAEGPTLLKYNGLYYLFYSANDFRKKDYAVGYAVSNSPIGPWQKFTGNPIISRQSIGINGTGHGDFFRDKRGDLQYVLHTHRTATDVSPRLTAIVKGRFTVANTSTATFVIDYKSFRFLSHSK
jgi:beta-xylosidase